MKNARGLAAYSVMPANEASGIGGSVPAKGFTCRERERERYIYIYIFSLEIQS